MLSNGPIVAGYDGTEGARDGLALALVLARSLERSIEVVSVLTYLPASTLAEYEAKLAGDERRLAEEAHEALPGLEVATLMIPSKSAPRELHDLAEARSAALIAIGSTHRGRLGRVFPGTAADRLLTAAPCPVAVAPRGYRSTEPSLERLLVAFDGSGEANVALDAAVVLSQRTGASIEAIAVAELRSVSAVAWGSGGGTAVTRLLEQETMQAQSNIDEAIARCPAGVPVTGRVVTDFDPRSVLEEASADADLLLVGSRGYGPLGRVLLGSVSFAVVRSAACPVIVTPRSSGSD